MRRNLLGLVRAGCSAAAPVSAPVPAQQRWCTAPTSTANTSVTPTSQGNTQVESDDRVRTNDFFVSVNQAMKATAVARVFLSREEKGLIARVENARVVCYERTTQTLPKLGAHVLLYNNEEVIEVQEREDERVLTVAARTLPRNLAAAIKQNMATNRNVTLRGVGPEAVENCALGIGFARNYCKQDEECDFDIGFVVEFTSLGEDVTGLSMMLIKLPPVEKDEE